jgi:HEPN domain-containing protein
MPRRHEDWFSQAQRDLDAAGNSMANANYEWAAFQAQQAAEKALKAVLLFFNREERHHSVVQLLNEAQKFAEVPQPLAEAARELDRHYIQTRYPNGFAEGYPAQYYDEKLATECVSHARNLVEFANRIIA